jgi:hypothetical protein
MPEQRPNLDITITVVIIIKPKAEYRIYTATVLLCVLNYLRRKTVGLV